MRNKIFLSNGIEMPALGFGTYKTGSEEETIEAVSTALQVGYRHIDTASFYENEVGVGKGIIQSGVPREEIFLTTKLWQHEQGFENALKAFEDSCSRLQVDYLDLYLIHWPTKLNYETWRALEKLYKEGKVKAIGVCNFKKEHLKELIEKAEIKPMVNQIQLHPELTEEDLTAYCKKETIQIVSWGPLERGKIYKITLLQQLAEKYNRSISQITLRWHFQKGYVAIPKSNKKERMKENFQIFDFELTKEDMKSIDGLNKNERLSKAPENTIF